MAFQSDDGDVLGMRYDNWKIAFMEQRRQGTLLLWGKPRLPASGYRRSTISRTDPYERAKDETSNSYWESV